MKFSHLQRKSVSLIVLVTFVALLHFWAAPNLAASTAGKSETAMTHGDNGAPKFIEHESGSTQVIKKAKKFPWLIVGLGAAAICVVLYFLLAKKSDDPSSKTKIYTNGILTINGVRYELAAIPAGEFQMGSDLHPEASRPGEQPVHTVRISRNFWVGKTEVTQGIWQAVMGSNPSNFKKGDTYPVEQVSWNDCQTFITKLNQLAGGNIFRLPTEAEWEYTCRAGTTGDRYGDIDVIAWYGDTWGGTHPVGQKQPNGFGLYDMLGNVAEWCQDYEGPYAAGYQTDPIGSSSGPYRIIRGRSFYNYASAVYSSARGWGEPDWLDLGPKGCLGFRLAANSAGN
jgi:formylglycine-generating enzyme required for sulfatase activity